MNNIEKNKGKYRQLFGKFKNILSNFIFGEVYYPVDDKQREIMTFAAAAKLFF